MASSNRHWPSMFKSKPCDSHQWQHEINSSLISNASQRASPPPPSYSPSGCEVRSPEPKPRWNPRPEQIRILESIFNSGMVNPPRDEMRKIRAQLQECGQVGDANVFYWFQNRKSRKKRKQQKRHLQSSQQSPQIPLITSSSSSSSSSEKFSQNSADQKTFSLLGPKNLWNNASSSPTSSVNQSLFQTHTEFLPITFFFPVQSTSTLVDSQWSNSFADATNDNAIQNSSSFIQ